MRHPLCPNHRPAIRRRSRGFTLIEQVMTIAAVGATSAAALPQFIEINGHAEAVALASAASAASSAMVLNLAGCLVTGQVPVPGKCNRIDDCAQLPGLLMVALAPGYRVPAMPISPVAQALPVSPISPIAAPLEPINGASAACTIVNDSTGASAVFVGLSAGR